jgi:hypothetical protein
MKHQNVKNYISGDHIARPGIMTYSEILPPCLGVEFPIFFCSREAHADLCASVVQLERPEDRALPSI